MHIKLMEVIRTTKFKEIGLYYILNHYKIAPLKFVAQHIYFIRDITIESHLYVKIHIQRQITTKIKKFNNRYIHHRQYSVRIQQ